MKNPLACLVLGTLLGGALALGASCDGDEAPRRTRTPALRALVPPLHDAKAGEWLRLEVGADALEYRIVGADDLTVHVEIVQYRDDVPVGPPFKEVWSRNNFGLPVDPAEGVVRRYEPDHIVAAGRSWDCWRLHVHSRQGVRYYWVTDELPVHGVIKYAGVSAKGEVQEAYAPVVVAHGFGE